MRGENVCSAVLLLTLNLQQWRAASAAPSAQGEAIIVRDAEQAQGYRGETD